ncbi:MAG TPA: hypothetical protein V6D07_18890 [Trichocoleus sp.]
MNSKAIALAIALGVVLSGITLFWIYFAEAEPPAADFNLDDLDGLSVIDFSLDSTNDQND